MFLLLDYIPHLLVASLFGCLCAYVGKKLYENRGK